MLKELKSLMQKRQDNPRDINWTEYTLVKSTLSVKIDYVTKKE